MRKKERIGLEAVLDNVQLIIRMQKTVLEMMGRMNEIVAEINLMDARVEMLEKQQ